MSASPCDAWRRRQPRCCQMADHWVPKFGTHFFFSVVYTVLLYQHRSSFCFTKHIDSKIRQQMALSFNHVSSRANWCDKKTSAFRYACALISKMVGQKNRAALLDTETASSTKMSRNCQKLRNNIIFRLWLQFKWKFTRWSWRKPSFGPL